MTTQQQQEEEQIEGEIILIGREYIKELAQHATSFWINKSEETRGSAGYKIENYINENDR